MPAAARGNFGRARASASARRKNREQPIDFQRAALGTTRCQRLAIANQLVEPRIARFAKVFVNRHRTLT